MGVLYYPTADTTFAAQRQTTLTGVFTSPYIDGTSALMRWDQILWTASMPTNTLLWVFVREADTVDGLTVATWNGPLLNGSGESLSVYTKRFLQVQIVLSGIGWPSDPGITPTISSFTVQGIQSGTEESIYTKAFDLGFVPKHFAITYNGRIPEGSLLQVAVAGDDTVDLSRYINGTVNRIQSLADLTDVTGKIKFMISILGNKMEPFEISGIGILVSGDGQTYLNP
jgi:hypothetical protein